MLSREIWNYNENQSNEDKSICHCLAIEIMNELQEAESKIWHSHPVWFIDGNPIVGYSKQRRGVRLMFWSGADFDDRDLNVRGKSFKDASIFYSNCNEINTDSLRRWLRMSRVIQWDYKNIVKRKGRLERLK
jgi:hypothetical protein